MAGRLPDSAHLAHRWVIADIAPDFRLLDAWELPMEGGPADFPAALDLLASFDPTRSDSVASRTLFALRLRLGRWFGWDAVHAHRPIPGCSETTLGARLPDSLRSSAADSAVSDTLQRVAGGFVPLYRTDCEWAAELSNATVHGVLHLAWVEQGDGRYSAHMGVYVKPRGWRGALYLRLIDPFRHLIVYPALMRQLARAWERRAAPRVCGESV